MEYEQPAEPHRPPGLPETATWRGDHWVDGRHVFERIEGFSERARRERRFGLFRLFRLDGSLMMFKNYDEKDKLHGEFKHFHSDGSVAMVGQWDQEVEEGLWIVTRTNAPTDFVYPAGMDRSWQLITHWKKGRRTKTERLSKADAEKRAMKLAGGATTKPAKSAEPVKSAKPAKPKAAEGIPAAEAKKTAIAFLDALAAGKLDAAFDMVDVRGKDKAKARNELLRSLLEGLKLAELVPEKMTLEGRWYKALSPASKMSPKKLAFSFSDGDKQAVLSPGSTILVNVCSGGKATDDTMEFSVTKSGKEFRLTVESVHAM